MEKNKTPRGIRNNNPLNIRYVARNGWRGRVPEKKDTAFEEFVDMRYGFRAAFILLYRYIRLEKRNTIFDIIAKWAPSEDNNDVYSYSDFVAQRCKIGRHEAVDFFNYNLMVSLALAMAYFENGQELSRDDALLGYLDACNSLGYKELALRVCKIESINTDKL